MDPTYPQPKLYFSGSSFPSASLICQHKLHYYFWVARLNLKPIFIYCFQILMTSLTMMTWHKRQINVIFNIMLLRVCLFDWVDIYPRVFIFSSYFIKGDFSIMVKFETSFFNFILKKTKVTAQVFKSLMNFIFSRLKLQKKLFGCFFQRPRSVLCTDTSYLWNV